MKTITRLIMFTITFAVLPESAFAATHGWIANFENGFARAKAENKDVFVNFTGSDWCPPCIIIHRDVLSKPEFISEASKRFVLVEIDLPYADKDLAAKNRPILDRYGVTGLPTAVVFTSNGRELTRFNPVEYREIDALLAHLGSRIPRPPVIKIRAISSASGRSARIIASVAGERKITSVKAKVVNGRARVTVSGKGPYIVKATRIETRRTVVKLAIRDSHGLRATRRVVLKR